LPIRRNYNGDLPVDGSSGDFEWDGYIPFDQLPRSYDPPRGWIATANQNPFPPIYQYRVNGEFAAPYRSEEIRDRLTSHTLWAPGDVLAVQKDVFSSFAIHLARELVSAYDRAKPAHPELSEAIQLLRSWNGQMEKQTAAPMVVMLAYDQLETRAVKAAWSGPRAMYQYMLAPAAIQDIVDSNRGLFFHDRDHALLDALVAAMEEGRRLQGGNLARWDWGAMNRLTIKHPVGSQLPLIGAYFNIGPVEMSGSSTTIKQTSPVLGPSMRFVADLSNWDQSLNNITIGQSGQVLSRHYKDQWNAYYAGRSFPMQFDKVDATDTLVIAPK
jgi:penicillin amidase